MKEVRVNIFDDPATEARRKANRAVINRDRADNPKGGRGLASAIPAAERVSTGRRAMKTVIV